jgi:hypothetical protein
MKKYTLSEEIKMYEDALRAMNFKVNINGCSACSIQPLEESVDPDEEANEKIDD